MKVLMISPMYPSQRNPVVGIFVKRQVEALQQLGIEVILVTNSYSTPRLNLFHRYSELLRLTLVNAVQEFDLVHVHFPTLPGVYGGLIAKVRHKPLVVTLHGAEIDEKQYTGLARWKRVLTRLSAHWALQQADHVIAVGTELAQLAAHESVPMNKITVIDMGVDCQLFRPRSKQTLRQQLNINLAPSDPMVLFVGALLPVKGPDYFIRAASLIKNSHPNSQWYLIGQGQYEAELRNLVAELGLTEQVTFVGQVSPEEVAKWNAAADLLIVPSLVEGFGLAGLEALACGIPVIASNVGGLPSYIEDGINGFLVPPADPEMIAHRVHTLLTDVQLRQKMGNNGVKTAAEHDIRQQAHKVLMLYEQSVRQRNVAVDKS